MAKDNGVRAPEPPAAASDEDRRGSRKPGVPREAPTDSFLQVLVEHTLPKQVAEPLGKLLGSTVAGGDGESLDVSIAGRFDGSRSVDLMAYARKSKLNGALVVAERDEERVLYFADGVLVGAASTVLFETLGRLLYQSQVVTHEDSGTLVDAEEQYGAPALLLWLSGDHLRWAVERRAWEVVAAVCLIKRGYFAFVGGAPVLDGPKVNLDPVEVAQEGERRRNEWRTGSGDAAGDYVPPAMPAPPTPLQRRAHPIDIGPETLRQILARISDAEAEPEAESETESGR